VNYLSDLILWGSERDDIDKKLYNEITAMSFRDILKLYEEVTGEEGTVLDRTKYDHIRAVIADKLELPQRDIIVPFITNLFNDLSDRIDELEKNFKNHRHDTSKSYTEKPAW